MIDASHFDANEAYAAVERHQLQDYEPYIYRTRDGGKTWQKITTGLPAGVYVQTVKEDPVRRGLLFAGTERGVFVSFNDGDDWQSLQLNLPATSMRDLAIHERRPDRGHARPRVLGARRHHACCARRAQRPPTATRSCSSRPTPSPCRPGTRTGRRCRRTSRIAENPPSGAVIDYYLKAASSGPVTLEILDASGQTIRRYSSDDRTPPRDPNTLNIPAHWVPVPEPLSAAAGMHRWVWDLRPTPPPAGGRGGGGGGGGGRGGAAMSPTGAYTVKLTVNGKSYTQPLMVKPDPRTGR